MANYYHINARRDTAANWAANNPTPSDGEICYETDTNKMKVGDGSTAYNSLAYFLPSTATTATAGLMSASDKTKLDGITLSLYAKLASPNFSGTPTAPTNGGYDVSDQIATNKQVLDRIAASATASMVRCIYTAGAAGSYTVAGDLSACVFMAVNGKAVNIDTTAKLDAGTNYIDFLFDTGSVVPFSQIPEGAFTGATLMTTVIFPERMLEVADNAFSGCSALATIWAMGMTPPTYYADTFSGTVLSGGNLYCHKLALDNYTAGFSSVGCTVTNF